MGRGCGNIEVVQMMKYGELRLLTMSAFGTFSLGSILTSWVQQESCPSDLLMSFVRKSRIINVYHALIRGSQHHCLNLICSA
jgi:hypothetical protein